MEADAEVGKGWIEVTHQPPSVVARGVGWVGSFVWTPVTCSLHAGCWLLRVPCDRDETRLRTSVSSTLVTGKRDLGRGIGMAARVRGEFGVRARGDGRQPIKYDLTDLYQVSFFQIQFIFNTLEEPRAARRAEAARVHVHPRHPVEEAAREVAVGRVVQTLVLEHHL